MPFKTPEEEKEFYAQHELKDALEILIKDLCCSTVGLLRINEPNDFVFHLGDDKITKVVLTKIQSGNSIVVKYAGETTDLRKCPVFGKFTLNELMAHRLCKNL